MGRPLKVLHVITSTRRGGAETQLLNLIRASQAGELRHQILSLEPLGEMAPLMNRAGAPVSSLGLKPGIMALWAGVRGVRRQINRLGPDLIQSWMYHADLLAVMAAGGRVPVVWSLRCSDLNLAHMSPASRLVVRACAALSDRPAAICVNSFRGLDWHAGLGYRRESLQVIPNGFDLERFRPDPGSREHYRRELGLDPDELAVGHVASFQAVKGHAVFLQACRLVAKREPRARFVLAGEGVTRRNPALALCEEEPLRGRVSLLGMRNDVDRLLPALDMLAASSLSEGFPNVVGEAMACALPVAATDVGDTRVVLGEGGRLSPAGDAFLLAGAISGVLALSPKERVSLGAMNRERLARRYGLSNLYREHLDLYGRLAG